MLVAHGTYSILGEFRVWVRHKTTNSTKRFSKSIQAFLLGDYLPRPELRVSKDVVSVGPVGWGIVLTRAD